MFHLAPRLPQLSGRSHIRQLIELPTFRLQHNLHHLAFGLKQLAYKHFSLTRKNSFHTHHSLLSFQPMEPYVGEIRAVGFNYAPNGWALCDGSLLQIRSNTALFSILGTQYGGNGTTTFGLPDLRSRIIVNAGTGAGLTPYAIGAKTGDESVTLNLGQMPAHTHAFAGKFNVNTLTGNANAPGGNFLSEAAKLQYAEEAGNNTMAPGMITGTVGPAGGNLPHSNIQPYLALNYVIALIGIFPQRS